MKKQKEKHLLPPNVEVKGDVRLDPQFVILRRFKYTVVCPLIVLEQLTVQKPESQGEDEIDLKYPTDAVSGQGRIFRRVGEMLINEQDINFYRINPLLEMISAWQSLTVSPLRLSSSPLTQRFPDRKQKKQIQCQKHDNAAPLSSAVT